MTTTTEQLSRAWVKPATRPDVAARRVAQWLTARFGLGDEPEVNRPMYWNRADVRHYGWAPEADAQVAWEGGAGWGAYGWAIELPLGDPSLYEACNIDRSRVFMEPYSGWLLSFYYNRL